MRCQEPFHFSHAALPVVVHTQRRTGLASVRTCLLASLVAVAQGVPFAEAPTSMVSPPSSGHRFDTLNVGASSLQEQYQLGSAREEQAPAAPVFLQTASAAARSHKHRRSHKRTKPRHHSKVAEDTQDEPSGREAALNPLSSEAPAAYSRQAAADSQLGAIHVPHSAVRPVSPRSDTHGEQTSVFESVTSKVKNLEAQLEEAELENEQTLSKHKVQYEQNLNAMHERNVEIARSNAYYVDEIGKLQRSNQAKRERAEMVREDIKALREDLSTMHTNLSAALDFTSGVLNNTAEENATQLQVLDELKHTDESRGAIEERENRLKEIAETSHPFASPADVPSFLQTAMVKDPPKLLLQTLNNGFEELKVEHDKRELELKRQFSDAFQQERKRYTSLLEEQHSLNTSKQSLQSLAERLETALSHLEKTRQVLEERGRSLRVYAQRLGIRPFPHQRSATAPKSPPSGQDQMDFAEMQVPEEGDAAETGHAVADHQAQETYGASRLREPDPAFADGITSRAADGHEYHRSLLGGGSRSLAHFSAQQAQGDRSEISEGVEDSEDSEDIEGSEGGEGGERSERRKPSRSLWNSWFGR